MPQVQLTGQIGHPDFADAVALLHHEAQIVNFSPELFVIAQRRPGEIGHREVESLRRQSPLAGIVGLLGSWCEGETRTGRPWLGVERLYWYEFPAWWRRQMSLRSSGRCPDWARVRLNEGLRTEYLVRSNRPHRSGLIVLNVARRETTDVLGDVLNSEGFSTVWRKPGQWRSAVRGAIAGIWMGGQLNEREAESLALFCGWMERDGAPVVAMLDFPRRDGVDRAIKLGAATVMGMPWSNGDLVATLNRLTRAEQWRQAA